MGDVLSVPAVYTFLLLSGEDEQERSQGFVEKKEEEDKTASTW
jgi:hypothetical protein